MIVVSLLFVFSDPAVAARSLCAKRQGSIEPIRSIEPHELKAEAEALLVEMRNRFFPDLDGIDIEIRLSGGRDFLMRTDFLIEEVFHRPAKRKYTIVFGTRYNGCYPMPELLKPVMVHELAHISDYVHWDSMRLSHFLLEYAFNEGYIEQYERDTDMHALDRLMSDPDYAAYANSLAHFRLWQYENMPEKIVVGKRRNYLSPEEIWNYDGKN